MPLVQPGAAACRRARRAQRRIVDTQGRPGVDEVGGVEPLLAVAVWQGDVDGGDARGGVFRDRHRAGAAHDHISDGVGGLHVVDVGHGRVMVVGYGRVVFAAVGVQDLKPRAGEPLDGVCQRSVDAHRALGAAGDQNGRATLLKVPRAQAPLALRAVRVHAHAGAHRHADDLAVHAGIRHRVEPGAANFDAQLVGHAGQRVGLQHEKRQAQLLRGQVRRAGDVAAGAEDGGSAAALHRLLGLAHTARQLERHGHELPRLFARNRHRVDQGELESAGRHDGGFEAAFGAEGDNVGPVGVAKHLGDCEGGLDVARGAAACDDDAEVLGSHCSPNGAGSGGAGAYGKPRRPAESPACRSARGAARRLAPGVAV